MMEMSERCLPRLTSMSSISKCQESEPQAGKTLFIEPLKWIEPLGSREGALRTDDRTCRSLLTGRTAPAFGRASTATWLPAFKRSHPISMVLICAYQRCLVKQFWYWFGLNTHVFRLEFILFYKHNSLHVSWSKSCAKQAIIFLKLAPLSKVLN